MSVQFSKGLEDVIADQTSISNVEGDLGRLSYRGYTIEQLVTLSFTRVVWYCSGNWQRRSRNSSWKNSCKPMAH